jgi:hypothetical protein
MKFLRFPFQKKMLTIILLFFTASLFEATKGKMLIEKIQVENGTFITKSVFEDGPYGGKGGDKFTDGGSVHLNGPITGIELRAALLVDAIRVK